MSLLDVVNRADWVDKAICSQTDPEEFFPEKGQNTAYAKQICSGCPVRQQCLDYAVDNFEAHGIWGGLSDRERRGLRQQRNTETPTPAQRTNCRKCGHPFNEANTYWNGNVRNCRNCKRAIDRARKRRQKWGAA